jgi:hypothetical protein
VAIAVSATAAGGVVTAAMTEQASNKLRACMTRLTLDQR